MSKEVFTLNQQNIRGIDSNSLLRLYDQANEVLAKCVLQQERLKAGRAVERIGKELQRRKIAL